MVKEEKGGGMAVRGHKLFDYAGLAVEPGLLFKLRGERNDTVLLGLKYVTPWTEGAGAQCDECGAEFAESANIDPHKLNRHSEAAKKAAAEAQRQAVAQPALRAELKALHPPHTHACPDCGADHVVNRNDGGRAA